jgi:hypothetical protein
MIALLAIVTCLGAQPIYDEGDWISYRDYRWMYSFSVGPRNVYVGTTGGVVAFSRYRDEYSEYWARTTGYYESEPLDSARVVAYHQWTQSLWCGSETGLFQREQPQDRWRKHLLPGMLSHYRVLSIGIGDNYLWVEAGPPELWWNPEAPFGEFFLYYGSPQVGGFIRFTSGHFRTPPSNGLLQGMANLETSVTWYGRLGKVPLNSGDLQGLMGVGRYNIPILYSDEPGIRFQEGDNWRPGYFEDAEFRQYALTDWQVDDRGILWLGTWGLGLAKSDLRTQRVSLKPAGLWGEDVQALLITDNDIWIGGMNDGYHQGITRWRDRRRWEGYEYLYINGLESTMVHDLALGNNQVWAATTIGLSSFDLKKKYWNTLTVFKGLWSDHVLSVSPFNGQVYVGTDRGLNRINQGVVIREQDWFRNLGVNRFSVDGDTLWAVNDAGIFRNINNARWESPKGTMSTVGPKTTDIAVTPNIIWFARRDGIEGLIRKTGNWRSLLATTHFDGQQPTRIAADHHNLWVGTGKGLYKFNIEQGSVINLYQPEDGLLNGRIQVLKLDGDYLWIGTNRGLCRFYWNDPTRGY